MLSKSQVRIHASFDGVDTCPTTSGGNLQVSTSEKDYIYACACVSLCVCIYQKLHVMEWSFSQNLLLM